MLDRLVALAERERRRPQDQAAMMLEKALEDTQSEVQAAPTVMGDE
jgi:hypothetical protein